MADPKELLLDLVDEGLKSGEITFKRGDGKHRVYGIYGELETFSLPGNANKRGQTWLNSLLEYKRIRRRADAKRIKSTTLAAAMTQVAPPKFDLPISFHFNAIELEPELAFNDEYEPEITEVEVPISIKEEETTMTSPAVALAIELTPESVTTSVLNPAIARAQATIDTKIAACREVVARAEQAQAEITQYENIKTWLAMAPEGVEAIIAALAPPMEVRVPTSVFVNKVTTHGTPLAQRICTLLGESGTMNSNQIHDGLAKTDGFDTKRTTILSSLDRLRDGGKVMRSEMKLGGLYTFWLA